MSCSLFGKMYSKYQVVNTYHHHHHHHHHHHNLRVLGSRPVPLEVDIFLKIYILLNMYFNLYFNFNNGSSILYMGVLDIFCQ